MTRTNYSDGEDGRCKDCGHLLGSDCGCTCCPYGDTDAQADAWAESGGSGGILGQDPGAVDEEVQA